MSEPTFAPLLGWMRGPDLKQRFRGWQIFADSDSAQDWPVTIIAGHLAGCGTVDVEAENNRAAGLVGWLRDFASMVKKQETADNLREAADRILAARAPTTKADESNAAPTGQGEEKA